jgi:hypothetical protein
MTAVTLPPFFYFALCTAVHYDNFIATSSIYHGFTIYSPRQIMA